MSFINIPGFVEDLAVGNDKVVVVPVNETWELLGVHITLLTTVTVGVRQVEIEVRDAGDNVLTRLQFGETQTASLTKRYSAALGLVTEIHIAGAMLFAQLPIFDLPPGFDIRGVDSADIDVLDTLSIRVNRRRSTEV